MTSLFGVNKDLEAKNNPLYLLRLAYERSVWHQLIKIDSSLQIIVAFFLSMRKALLELIFFHLPPLLDYHLKAAFNVIEVNNFSSFSVARSINGLTTFFNHLSVKLTNTSLFGLIRDSVPAVYKC